MEETLFPPSPSWFLPNIITAKKDGSLAYGSKNNIVILKSQPNNKPEMRIIHNAHTLRITGVAFSPPNCAETLQNTIASCSDDGFVKLWKIDTLTATIGHKSHLEQKGENGKIVSIDWSLANPHFVVSAAENNSLVLWDTFLNSTVKFSFQILGPTVVSCCPYNEKIVAVGGKTGQIYIISLTGNGDILYRLRGHDNKINSLSWCPVPYNVFKANDILEECLLASACQNKEVFIWRAGSDGKCESKFQIPTSALCKRDGTQHGKIGNSFSYVALCWLEPYKIYSSSNFGELIYFDIKFHLSNKMSNGASSSHKSNKQNVVKLAHYFHTKGLFAIVGWPMEGEIRMHKNKTVVSELKFPLQSNNIKITEKTGSEFNGDTWDVILPETTSLVSFDIARDFTLKGVLLYFVDYLLQLWTAGQDRKLVACDLKSSKLEAVFNFNTLNGIVHSIMVSPHDPNNLAIGAGDGMIRLWNLTEPSGEIQVYWQKIKDRVMSLDWHPTRDGLLAYGTSEGRVGLVDTKSNKLPNVFKPSHPQPIYNLSWGPQFPSENSKNPSDLNFDLYAVGDNTLSLYNPGKLNSDPLNLSKIISFPCKKQTDVRWKPDYSLMAVGNDDGSICLVEPSQFKVVHTILAYKKLIHSIAWHPMSTSTDSGVSPYHGYLTSASTDNNYEVRVFDCQKEADGVRVEQVATLKGHNGQIQSVSWSPHISCRLLSASADGSVQIWDVISQTPLVSFIPCGMPTFSTWSPVDPDFILTGCKKDVLCVWRISTQTKVSPPLGSKAKKTKTSVKGNIQLSTSKELVDMETSGKNLKKNEGGIIPAESKTSAKGSTESKMFPNIWKGKGSDELKNCYSLLKNGETENGEGNYSLPFFCDEDRFNEAVRNEEEACRKGNKWTELTEMALWNGNIKEVLQERIASGQLNDFLVSLAPIISLKVWQDACFSYSKTLAEKKLYRRAASYLLVCHKIYEAIQLLVEANLYLEAIFIARTRLPKLDPMLEKIVRKYAEKLFKNGALLKACECYIYLRDYQEVARICGKSKQPEYLSLAALAAKKSCSRDLETLEATNALFKCFETNNFELAQQICDDHDNLRHLGLLFYVYSSLQKLEAGELELSVDFLSHVRSSFKIENVVFPSFLPKLFHRYNSYKNKRQMYTIVAQELSLALCSESTDEILTHLIRALSTCHRYEAASSTEVHPLFELCHWLSPEGFLSSSTYFTSPENKMSPKVKSLRAHLCAAIVTHLHYNEDVDVVKYIDALRELKNDLLDADSYKYYKNLMSLKACEKEVLESQSKLSRRTKLEKSLGTESDETTEDSESGQKQHSELEDNGCGHNGDESVENKNLSTLDNGSCVEPGCISEDTVKEKLDLMKLLKNEIENFEKERISSPHPFPVCAWLKKLCERFPENQSANSLLRDLEEKWFQMN